MQSRDDDQATGAVSEEARLFAERYVPRSVPPGAWDLEMQAFVRTALIQAASTGLSLRTRCATVLAQLAMWARNEGIGLDPEVVLDPQNVERFVTSDCCQGTNRVTYRSDLRRLGPLLTRHAPWEPRPQPLGYPSLAAPYTDSEVRSLADDIAAQPTLRSRQALSAVLSLGLGAGLDGRWLTHVRLRDVHRRSAGFDISVPAPMPRTIPVWNEWTPALREVIDGASAGDGWIGGDIGHGRNWLGQLQARFVRGASTPPISTQRLRATWLLQHLRARTPVLELVTAAGLRRLDSLSGLLRHVEPLAAEDRDRVLRGPK